jgi:non-specific serine/threonine protein kinase
MDFGIAKLGGQSRLTHTGTTVGTTAYMSPEQTQGEEVDLRTDIWCLGVVLFEMLTGQLPFKGEQMQGMVYSILNKEPELITSIRSDIPEHIEKTANKALEKEASKRYQDTQELIQDLKQSPTITFPKAEKSIVVLPFENLSPDPEQEYFCDGMTEEIISDLSQAHALLVISRSSAMTYKDTMKKITEIGRELKVQYALEGSVRKSGNNLRITAQLIDTETDAHIWAGKYSGNLNEVFEIQEKVSFSIVEALKLKLTPEEEKQLSAHPIDNVQAYELHLRARYEMWLVSEDRINHAIQLIRDGLRVIGDNELLYFDLGQGYLLYHDFAIRKEESLFIKTEECIDKIFELNTDSSYGHSLRGNLHRRRGNCQQAVREWKQSLVIDPNNLESLGLLTWVYLHSGKVFVARSFLKKNLDVDPLMPLNHLVAGVADLMDGKFDLSLKELEKTHQMEKEVQIFQYWIGKSLAYAGRHREALEVFDAIEKQKTKSVWEDLSAFSKASLQGRKSKALSYLTEDFRKMMRDDEMYPLWIAENLALIDEKEEAVTWLEHGADCGFINFPFLSEYDPLLANIRSETRFKKFIERVKHEWENFEV